MHKGNQDVLVEYEEQRFSPKVLMNEPGYRMVLLSLRARQTIPEQASRGIVTLYVVLGHITLFAGPFPDELYAGQVTCIESGVRHRIEAFEDSALLVLFRRYELLYGVGRRTGFVRGSETQRRLFESRYIALGESFALTTDQNRVLLNREFETTRRSPETRLSHSSVRIVTVRG